MSSLPSMDADSARRSLKENFKKKFSSLDKDKNGFLDLGEMTELLMKGKKNINKDSIRMCFEAAARGDGKVSFEEFVDFICPDDFSLIKSKLPAGRSNEDKEKRKQLFRAWDMNGNRILSLAEIDKGIRAELCIGDIGPTGMAPVLMRAYQVARDYGNSDMRKVYGMKAAMELKKSDIYASTVNLKEIRVLFEYIHHYFELYQLFKKFDKDFDGRIGKSEFDRGRGELQKAGFANCNFEDLDLDRCGKVLFDEFCAFLIGFKLDRAQDDDM
jgi:Ca2+-binding EF-hand superfamily protein